MADVPSGDRGKSEISKSEILGKKMAGSLPRISDFARFLRVKNLAKSEILGRLPAIFLPKISDFDRAQNLTILGPKNGHF